MNRVKYKFHPSEYELGENEKFYSDMEAKGWRLVKRGGYLSKFVPVEPSRPRYRVEVTSPAFLEEQGLTEGQLAVFEDCGWEYVDSRGFLHIFRAPEGSDAPEFYTDPAQQAQTLKKVRRDMWLSLGLAIVLLSTPFAFIRSPARFYGDMFRHFVLTPALYAIYALLLLWGIYQAVWSAWKISRTYRRLKNGIPLDHAPKGGYAFDAVRRPVVLSRLALLLVLLTAQVLGSRPGALPETADGPYLLARDLGWEGERAGFMGRDSTVAHTRSLLSEYWDTAEYIRTPEGETVWMYQDVYRLRFPGMADALAHALMDTAVFQTPFIPIKAAGLDAAWAAGCFEVVAVKGNMVAYLDGMGASGGDFDPEAVCAALQAIWGD